MELKVLGLNHDELVAIISDGMYGNHDMGIDYNHDDWDALDDKQKTEDPCFEDKCADLLLAGKSITLVDYNAEDYGLHGTKGHMESNLDEDGEYLWYEYYGNEVGVYSVTLQDFLDACSTKDGLKCIVDIIREDDDFYTGYNLLQIAMFGEIIYG